MSLWTNWKEYYELTKGKSPRRLLVQALPYVEHKESALDLGAGALSDSIYLLNEGFAYVTAVDAEPLASEIAHTLPSEKFEYVIEKMEAFQFPTHEYDLVTAQYALPFVHPDQFETVWSRLTESLKEGGVVVGQLFGNRDGWCDKNTMTFLTRTAAEGLFDDLNVLEFEEEEVDKATAAGIMKHWHVFHFIARAR